MNLKPGAHIHFMGICGTAMASLAGLMKDRGFHVTGSDQNPYPPMSTQLEELGIQIQVGYRAENLNPRPDFVIVGNVISKSNAEAEALLKTDIPYTSLPKALGEFIIEDRESIVVSGTHGKTTTTSLMAWVSEVCQKKAGFMIGGIAKNFSRSFRNPEGNYFIIEGDEYDTAFFDKVPKFIHYKPKHVILTSVEFDHADIYRDLDHVKEAFAMLMKLIPQNGTLLACREDQNVMGLTQFAKVDKLYTYGFLPDSDFKAKVISTDVDLTHFEVSFRGQSLGEFKMPLSGDYNVLNATAAVGVAYSQGWDLDLVKKAFETFQGIKRRQEVLGEPNGVLLIEDFAHHPTAVRETIKGIQAKYQGRPILAVFEPRSATSRRKVFQKDYVEAFSVGVKQAILAKAFDQTKIDSENRFSSEELVEDLNLKKISAHVFNNSDEIVTHIQKVAVRGDLVLIMSNGGFDGIYGKLMKALG